MFCFIFRFLFCWTSQTRLVLKVCFKAKYAAHLPVLAFVIILRYSSFYCRKWILCCLNMLWPYTLGKRGNWTMGRMIEVGKKINRSIVREVYLILASLYGPGSRLPLVSCSYAVTAFARWSENQIKVRLC